MLQFRFGGYDLSPLIDSAWRVLSGQAPNRDFVCTFPPSLYLLVAAAFHFAGVRWQALGMASAVSSIGLTLLGVRLTTLLRRSVGDSAALTTSLAFALAQMIPLLVVSHPWHSALSQSFVCYALLATYTLVRLDRTERKHHAELVAHVAFALAVLLLSKPNLSLPGIVVCLIAIVAARLPWMAIGVLAAAIAGSSLALWSVGTNLLKTYAVYFQLSERVVPSYFWLGLIKDANPLGGLGWLIAFLPITPLLWLAVREAWRKPRKIFSPGCLLVYGGALVTLLGWGSDFDLKIVETPAILVGFSLLPLECPEQMHRLRPPLLRAAVFLVIVSVFLCGNRSRMQQVGLWAEDSCGPRVEVRDRFFGTLQNCTSLHGVLEETDWVMEAHPHAKVFFGPRIEFEYARERVLSPLHLPLWWHPDTSYPRRTEASIVRAWEDDRFDLLVFARNDRTRMPQGILDDIAKDFKVVPGMPELDVFVRKTDGDL